MPLEQYEGYEYVIGWLNAYGRSLGGKMDLRFFPNGLAVVVAESPEGVTCSAFDLNASLLEQLGNPCRLHACGEIA